MSTVLLFFVVISVLIVIHELGHFIAARIFGIRVLEFALGFPPRIASVVRGETRYSLNAIPLGGYVKLAGEEDPTDPRSLARQSIPVRAIVLSAGVVMNLALTIFLFSIFLTFPPEIVDSKVAIARVLPGSPAEQAGLLPGDIVLRTDAKLELGDLSAGTSQEPDDAIRYSGDLVETPSDLIDYTKANLGSEISLLVARDSTPVIVRMVPRRFPPPEEGPDSHLGVMIGTTGGRVVSDFQPSLKVIPESFRQVGSFITGFKDALGNIISREGESGLVGPIGIAQVTGEVARAGILPLIGFAGILSLSLAIFNILPIPALDGGRLLFVIIEALRGGKRIPPEREALIHLVGFVVLIAVILLISYNDILRIIRGEDVLQ
ncbi:MAG: M50 family metallopeptidase [Thermoplasmata archaeon]